MSPSIRVLILGALVVSVGLVACRANQTPSAAGPAAATPVHMVQVSSGPAQPPLRAIGLIAGKDSSRLSFKVGGIVAELAVREGAAVRRGQLLATIEQVEVAAQLEQARLLKEKAERDLARGERLYGDEVITLEQVQDLRTQAQIAGAGFKQASFNRQYASIVAPHDGLVQKRFVELRQQVTPGQPIFTVSSTDAGYVLRVAVADRDIVRAHLGDQVSVTLDAFPGQILKAQVSELAAAADQGTGMFALEARLSDPPERLSAGMVGKLELIPAAGELPTIPLNAVVEGDGMRASAYLVRSGIAKRVAIEVAYIDREYVAVRAGLVPGDTVVTDGVLYLADGERVVLKKD